MDNLYDTLNAYLQEEGIHGYTRQILDKIIQVASIVEIQRNSTFVNGSVVSDQDRSNLVDALSCCDQHYQDHYRQQCELVSLDRHV